MTSCRYVTCCRLAMTSPLHDMLETSVMLHPFGNCALGLSDVAEPVFSDCCTEEKQTHSEHS